MNKINKDTYFNNDSNLHSNQPSIQSHIKKRNPMEYFAVVTTVLSLISLIILIMLNVTTLIKTYSNGNEDNSCVKYFSQVAEAVKTMGGTLNADIQPKVNLITSASSYTIPSMIDNLGNVLTSEINEKCGKTTINATCPPIVQKVNDPRFSMLNTKATDKCLFEGGTIKVSNDQSFLNYPSFIPGSTIPDTCTRYPSFSLSKTIFSYTHTLYPGGCDSSPPLSQTWLLGYIGNGPSNEPEPRVITSWNMGSVPKRHFCSTVAGSTYGWLGCAVWEKTFGQEIWDNNVKPVIISYMDTSGRRREWSFDYTSIHKDEQWGSIFFGTGSGVILEGYVYMLVFGTLVKPSSINSYCEPVWCTNYNQQMCNEASWFSASDKRQLVNGVVSFLDEPNIRPTLRLQTIPPNLNWQGGPGRLIYDEVANKLIINTKSSGWNPYLQIGWMYYTFPINITWVKFPSLRRPGYANCNAENNCPRRCITGAFTDAYPLTSDLRLVASCVLNSVNQYINPKVVTATPIEVTGERLIFATETASGETTTTCFMYDGYVWCLSLVENANQVNNNLKITPFLYRLITECGSETWWSVAQKNPYLSYLTPYVPTRVTEMLKDRKTTTDQFTRLQSANTNTTNTVSTT
ncbi:cell attachment protein [Piparella virus]|nr:cell attachment protein [Piparella virus]